MADKTETKTTETKTMSETKTNGLKEIIAARQATPLIVTKAVAGIGEVRIRRLNTGEILQAASEGVRSGPTLVLAAVMDEEGKPYFKSFKEVHALDFAIYTALVNATNEVNSLDVQGALGN